jgi:outer membrane protein assembly factor BamB
LNANTGKELWSVSTGPYVPLEVSLGQNEIRSSPIIYDGNIYVGSNGGNFYCISSSGTILWSYNTGGPIISSAAIWNNTVYIPTWGSSASGYNDANNVFEFNAATGAKVFNFTTYIDYGRVEGGAFGTIFGMAPAYTPVVVAPGILYIGTQTANMAAYNVTSGTLMWSAEQPYVLGENSLGSPVYVPTAEGGQIFCQAGPAMVCVNASQVGQLDTNPGSFGFFGYTPNPLFNTTTYVPFNVTQPSGQNANNNTYTNLWAAWGGWEIWSSPIYSGLVVPGFAENASQVIYSGSDSYSMTCWNASNGFPLSWFTTGGSMPGSAAIYDGALYFGSADNKVYCFYDHVTENTAIDVSVDASHSSVVGVATGDNVTVSALLSVPITGTEGEPFTPGLPNSPVVVTVESPGGTFTNLNATTDLFGAATTSFIASQAGNWTVLSSYAGATTEAKSYSYAVSGQVIVTASGAAATSTPTATATPTSSGTASPTAIATATATSAATGTPTPTSTSTSTKGTDYTMWIYAAIAVIVIIIIVVAALMLMRRRKK